jgi:hypothetical protein
MVLTTLTVLSERCDTAIKPSPACIVGRLLGMRTLREHRFGYTTELVGGYAWVEIGRVTRFYERRDVG